MAISGTLAMLIYKGEPLAGAVNNILADLQYMVELIPLTMEKWQEGLEIRICHRSGSLSHFIRKMFSLIAYKVSKKAIIASQFG
jgi:hypothetical protein